jgi:hypothetical protein
MARFAVIDKDNKVVNVIEWDEVSSYNPGEGLCLVKSEICDRDDDFDPSDESFVKKDGKKHHKDKSRSEYKRGR